MISFIKRALGIERPLSERAKRRKEDGFEDSWYLHKDEEGIERICHRYDRCVFPKSLIPQGKTVSEFIDDKNEEDYQRYLGNAKSMFMLK